MADFIGFGLGQSDYPGLPKSPADGACACSFNKAWGAQGGLWFKLAKNDPTALENHADCSELQGKTFNCGGDDHSFYC
jgi:hypothetical protein